MTGLRPGEKKILKALLEGPKSYTQLHNETKLQYNILSEYLKRFQKLSLVTRDIDTRKYEMRKRCLETLFFGEILDFIEDRYEKNVNFGLERGGIIPTTATGWLILTDNILLRDYLNKHLTLEPEIQQAFLKISQFIEDSWDTIVFSSYDLPDRKIIKKYTKFLLEYLNSFIVSSRKTEETELSKLLKKFDEEILRPHDLESLKQRIKLLKNSDQLRNDLSEKEIETLKEMELYLEKPKNKKIYEAYLKRVKQTPKALVLYPSWGFKGYLEKLKDLFPEEAIKVKEERKKLIQLLRTLIKSSEKNIKKLEDKSDN